MASRGGASVHWEVQMNIPQIESRLKSEANRKLNEAADLLENRIKNKLKGEGSGKVYSLPGGGTYRASAPGEPPAERTGDLLDDVTRATDSDARGNPSVLVGNTLGYAAHLELGTRKMGKRPYIKPALTEIAQRVEGILTRGWRVV